MREGYTYRTRCERPEPPARVSHFVFVHGEPGKSDSSTTRIDRQRPFVFDPLYLPQGTPNRGRTKMRSQHKPPFPGLNVRESSFPGSLLRPCSGTDGIRDATTDSDWYASTSASLRERISRERCSSYFTAGGDRVTETRNRSGTANLEAFCSFL